MPTSTYPTISGGVGKTQADKFIPELWSDEILATFKQNLVIHSHSVPNSRFSLR
jgi:hypothetical protein